MTITEAITTTYLKATGKTGSISTSVTSKIVGYLNFYQKRWAREPGIDWNSLYDPAFSIGTVTATDSFDLDTSTIRKISDREGDYVRIIHSDDEGYTDYTLVDADSLKDYYYGPNKESFSGFYCARIGDQLVFNHTFTSDDSQYGGEIFVPVYIYTDEITNNDPDNDEVQVDDPDWLCTRAAAEYCRNNITLRTRWPELKRESDEMMGRMVDDNDGQVTEVDKPWTPFTGGGSAWS